VDLLLIIDEINRGDISKIFGELIYALEYRGKPVATPYDVDGDATITIPENLLLLGTMNTADRSIALIDYALRRRFVFVDVPADRNVIAQHPWFVSDSDRQVSLRLFDATAELFSDDESLRNLAVGPSYFLPASQQTEVPASVAALARRFVYEVCPLLREYEAEGRFGRERLAQLMTGVGAPPDWAGQPQAALATALAASLQTVSLSAASPPAASPPAASPPAAGSP
jgi:5-methylcytosine-specific restriction protein B